MSQKIRAVRPQDNLSNLTEAIFALLTAIYGQSPWTKKYILQDLQSRSSRYILLEQEEQLIGFMALSIFTDEMEITNLAVHPDFQRQGHASNLLRQLSDFTGTIFLEVRLSNLTAQHLYEKFDFETYHIRKDYYNHPIEDALLMKKEQF